MTNDQVPCSPADEIDSLPYVPRLLSKIRLHAAGRLREDLHANLGSGLDGWFCSFVQVSYEELRQRALAGATDAEALEWCQTRGRRLNDTDKLLWRNFVLKLGWQDRVSATLARRKEESGLAGRDDIQTIAAYIDADEGRSGGG
jgi:Domain of unknown function (DUF5069)